MSIIVTRHILKLVKDEKKMLRDELNGLKKCQIQFLTGAIVSVGVLARIMRHDAGIHGTRGAAWRVMFVTLPEREMQTNVKIQPFQYVEQFRHLLVHNPG